MSAELDYYPDIVPDYEPEYLADDGTIYTPVALLPPAPVRITGKPVPPEQCPPPELTLLPARVDSDYLIEEVRFDLIAALNVWVNGGLRLCDCVEEEMPALSAEFLMRLRHSLPHVRDTMERLEEAAETNTRPALVLVRDA